MTQIDIICLVVVTIVVFFYTLAFFLAFKNSHHYQRKVINSQDMDEEICEYLVSNNVDYFGYEGGCCLKRNKGKNRDTFLTLAQYRDKRKRHDKNMNIASNVITVIFYFLIIACLGVGIYCRVNNENLFIGSNSYLVIESGSMSKKNSSNTYLFDEELKKEYDFDNQFDTFHMIQLEKIKSDQDIKLYDVIAYRGEDKEIIVHRVIDIETDEETGVLHFKFRGDANNSSSEYEYHGHDSTGLGLTMDDLIGRYTGWKNYGLGIFISYIRSDIGIICLASGFLAICLYYYYAEKGSKLINKRENLVVKRMDRGKDTRYKWYNVKYRMNKRYKTLTDDLLVDDGDRTY